MKKTIAFLMAMAMVLSLAACGSSSAPAASEAAPAASEAAPAASEAAPAPAENSGEKITLRFSAHDPETSDIMRAAQEFFAQINEVTNGQVEVQGFYSAQLASVKDVGNMVATGGVDMGWVYTSYYPTQFTLTDVNTLPLQGFGNNVTATEMLWDIYEGSEYPLMAEQWNNEYKVLQLYANPAMIFEMKNELTSVDQLKGLTIRCPAGAITDVLAAWGASGVMVGPPDIYEQMEKNVIDGFIFEEAGSRSFSLYEVTSYYVDMPLYTGAFSIAMNKDVWNSLPGDVQAAIDSIVGRETSLASAEAFAASVQAGRDAAKDAGVQFIVPSDAEMEGWKVEADKFAEKWCEDISASAGIDGAAYLQYAKDCYAAHVK